MRAVSLRGHTRADKEKNLSLSDRPAKGSHVYLSRSHPLTLLLFTAAIHFGSANAQRDEPPVFRIVDSGFPAEIRFADDLRWVDDRRLLFTGVELGTYSPNGKYEDGYGPTGLKIHTYLWDTVAKTVRLYKDGRLGSVCTQRSYISYRLLTRRAGTDEVVVYAGEFGQEKRIERPELRWFNPVSCIYASEKPAWIKRREELGARSWVSPLLEYHGWLEETKGLKNSPSTEDPRLPVLRKNESDPGKVLSVVPFPSRTLNQGYDVSFVPFLDRYLIHGRSNSTTYLAPAWYLEPNGSTRAIKVPDGPWRGARRYVAVRPGVLLFGGRHQNWDDPGDSGEYLIANERATKVLTGWARGLRASPGGCLVAFVLVPYPRYEAEGMSKQRIGQTAHTVQMTDVCLQRERHGDTRAQ